MPLDRLAVTQDYSERIAVFWSQGNNSPFVSGSAEAFEIRTGFRKRSTSHVGTVPRHFRSASIFLGQSWSKSGPTQDGFVSLGVGTFEVSISGMTFYGASRKLEITASEIERIDLERGFLRDPASFRLYCSTSASPLRFRCGGEVETYSLATSLNIISQITRG